MNTDKIKVHFTDNNLINPTNPIAVHVIGAGGTGSKVITMRRATVPLPSILSNRCGISCWDIQYPFFSIGSRLLFFPQQQPKKRSKRTLLLLFILEDLSLRSCFWVFKTAFPCFVLLCIVTLEETHY